jgi:hypothetical protein
MKESTMARVRRSASSKHPMPLTSLLVPGLAALGGLAFLVWKPGVARSMLASPRALAFTLMIGALVLAAGWLLPRWGRGPMVTALVQLVPASLAFVVAVLPAFHQVTVQEAFPAAKSGRSAAPSAAPSTADRAAVVASGELVGIDHSASGRVLLIRRDDGSYVVRLAGLDVEPGPDYHVHLVPGADRHGPGGGVHLDRLRGNRGNQNYDVPADVEVQPPVTLLIWCRAFAVPIAAATLDGF